MVTLHHQTVCVCVWVCVWGVHAHTHTHTHPPTGAYFHHASSPSPTHSPPPGLPSQQEPQSHTHCLHPSIHTHTHIDTHTHVSTDTHVSTHTHTHTHTHTLKTLRHILNLTSVYRRAPAEAVITRAPRSPLEFHPRLK